MKQTLFEPSARCPLIFAGAGVAARGKNTMRTVEFLDMYPTLVEVCGLSGAPGNLHGRSLVPLLKNANARWDKPAITQVRRGTAEKAVHGHSLRNERYRYTMWQGGEEGEELYDYETDPREMRNLAADPKLAGLKGRLKTELTGILKTRGRA
jgi:iduronate 2-sulfatase